MPPEDYQPVIDYTPPENNHTLNDLGQPELYNPSFLYSQKGPAEVARIVEL